MGIKTQSCRHRLDHLVLCEVTPCTRGLFVTGHLFFISLKICRFLYLTYEQQKALERATVESALHFRRGMVMNQTHLPPKAL